MNKFKSKNIISILTCSILYLSSCGIKTVSNIPTNVNVIGAESLASVPDSGEILSIEWDYFWAEGEKESITVADSLIAQKLNERFNVVLDSRKYIGADLFAQKKLDLASGNLPDISKTESRIGFKPYIDSGQVREIPWEMIELYAPRYAGMINSNVAYKNYLMEDEYTPYTIWSLVYNLEILEGFSAYRLDWLEELNIMPNGPIVEITDRLYFTEEAFTQEQSEMILTNFSNLPGHNNTYGLKLSGTYDDFFGARFSTLMGMFKLNLDVMNQQGQPVMFFASDPYRQVIEFLCRLRDNGALYLPTNLEMINFNTGWEYIESISEFGDNFADRQTRLLSDSSYKLLITPPEIGFNGNQGVYNAAINEVNTYADKGSLFISADVSDRKLAKILEILDGVSFDPELYMLANFGIEGEDFTWTGTPYDSIIEINPDSNTCSGVFTTNIMDENAGRILYTYPSQEIYDFATSDRAKAMIIKPYRSNDNLGSSDDVILSLSEQYPIEHVQNIAIEYYRSVMAGEQSIDRTWDDYLQELNEAGAAEWAEAIFNQPAFER